MHPHANPHTPRVHRMRLLLPQTLLGRRAGPEGEQPMVSYLQEEWGRQMVAGVAGSNRWQLTAQRCVQGDGRGGAGGRSTTA